MQDHIHCTYTRYHNTVMCAAVYANFYFYYYYYPPSILFKYSYITQFAVTLYIMHVKNTRNRFDILPESLSDKILHLGGNKACTHFIPISIVVSEVLQVFRSSVEIQNRDNGICTFRRKNNNRKMHIIANIMLLEQRIHFFA